MAFNLVLLLWLHHELPYFRLIFNLQVMNDLKNNSFSKSRAENGFLFQYYTSLIYATYLLHRFLPFTNICESPDLPCLHFNKNQWNLDEAWHFYFFKLFGLNILILFLVLSVTLTYRLKVVFATLLLDCFVSLKESTCEARQNAFYFTSKALFVLEIIKFIFVDIQMLWRH